MKVKIVYYSRTGNIEKFVTKLNHNNTLIIEEGLKINEPYVMIAPTINFGEVPIEYKKFLKENNKFLLGVAGSGNRNWGKNFAIAADIIAEKYNVPIIHKFELSGNTHDVEKFINKVEEIEKENNYEH